MKKINVAYGTTIVILSTMTMGFLLFQEKEKIESTTPANVSKISLKGDDILLKNNDTTLKISQERANTTEKIKNIDIGSIEETSQTQLLEEKKAIEQASINQSLTKEEEIKKNKNQSLEKTSSAKEKIFYDPLTYSEEDLKFLKNYSKTLKEGGINSIIEAIELGDLDVSKLSPVGKNKLSLMLSGLQVSPEQLKKAITLDLINFNDKALPTRTIGGKSPDSEKQTIEKLKILEKYGLLLNESPSETIQIDKNSPEYQKISQLITDKNFQYLDAITFNQPANKPLDKAAYWGMPEVVTYLHNKGVSPLNIDRTWQLLLKNTPNKAYETTELLLNLGYYPGEKATEMIKSQKFQEEQPELTKLLTPYI